METKKRIDHGLQRELANAIEVSDAYMSMVINRKRFPNRKRSLELESVCKERGIDIPAEIWAFGSKAKIETALSGATASPG